MLYKTVNDLLAIEILRIERSLLIWGFIVVCEEVCATARIRGSDFDMH